MQSKNRYKHRIQNKKEMLYKICYLHYLIEALDIIFYASIYIRPAILNLD
jgi:hypothetical protein